MAENLYKLMALQFDICVKVVREYLKHHSGYNSLADLLNGEKHNLYHRWYPQHNGNCCCGGRIRSARSQIIRVQFDLLFAKEEVTPPCALSQPHHCWFKAKSRINFDVLDITLARLLIVHVITALSSADSAALEEIRMMRNKLAHLPQPRICDQEFEVNWYAASKNILHLARTLPSPFAIDIKHDIDKLKYSSLNASGVSEVLRHVQCVNDVMIEKIKVIVWEDKSKVLNVKSEVLGFKSEVLGVKSEVLGVKREVLGLKSEVLGVKSEILGVKRKVWDLKSEVEEVQSRVKSEVEEVKCEVGVAKIEVQDGKDLSKDVKGAKRLVQDDQCAVNDFKTEIHRDPRLVQLIENTQIMLKTFQKSVYAVGSKAEKTAYKGLCRNHFITITGQRGAGKTCLGKKLMQQICSEEIGGTVRYIPIILDKADDFDLLNGKEHLVVLIDDPFGKSNLDSVYLDKWIRRFEKMVSFVNDGKTCIIMCARSSILKECVEQLSGVELFKEGNKIDLSGDLKLTSSEKYDMLKTYINHKEAGASSFSRGSTMQIQIDDSILKEMSESDPLGFPQTCHLFFSREDFFNQGLDFFKQPDDNVQKDVYKIRKNDPLQYIVLVFILLEGGEINFNNLNEEKLYTLCELTRNQPVSTEDIKECVLYESIYIKPFENATKSSIGRQDLVFGFTHETILETLLLSLCKHFPEVFLQLGQDYQISQFARPEEYKKKSGEICYCLPPKCNGELAKHVVSRYSYDGIDSLLYHLVDRRLHTDKTFVDTVFDAMGLADINEMRRDGYDLFSNFMRKHNADFDLLCFLKALCKRFANYKQTSPQEFVATERSLGKLKLPVSIFIDILQYNLDCGKIDVLENLLGCSGLDLHLRYNAFGDIYETDAESVDYIETCDVDERCSDVQSDRKGYATFLYQSFGNPLCYACVRGYRGLLLRLLGRTETANLYKVIERLLYILIEKDWSDALQKVIDRSGNVFDHTDQSKLILHAAQCGCKSSVIYLLKFIVDLTAIDAYGKTLLHYCCEKNWVDVFLLILKNYKGVQNQPGLSSALLILHATSHKSERMVLHLLQDNVDLTVCDWTGKTFFHRCCENNWPHVFDQVLEKGKYPVLPLLTLIIHAAENEGKQIVLHLLKYVVELTVHDEKCQTLLHFCCKNDWVDVFDQVLEKDKDVSYKSGLSLSLFVLDAARHESKHVVLHLLKYIVDLTFHDEKCQTLLHFCCKNDWVDVFNQVLEKDKGVLRKVDLSPSLLILLAAKYHREQMVSRLLKDNVDFSIRDDNGKTLLHYCCEHDWVDVFHKILEKDKDVLGKTDLSPLSLILHAAYYHRKQMVSCFLKYDVVFPYRDKNGKTLLHYCCENDWVDVFQKILEKDKNVLAEPGLSPSLLVLHAASYNKKMTELYFCSNGTKQMVSHLLQYNVDFTVRDENDKTLLHYCCENSWIDIFDSVLQSDQDLLSNTGLSPSDLILHAAGHKSEQMVLHLLGYKIDFSRKDKHGKTVLFYGCLLGWMDIVLKIVTFNPEITNLKETSGLFWAGGNYRKEVIRMLLEYGANLSMHDNKGNTLLHYCVARGWFDIIPQYLADKTLFSCKNNNGISPLHTAFLYLKPKAIKIISRVDRITLEERNTYSKVICLGMLMCVGSEPSISPYVDDFSHKLAEHYLDFAVQKRVKKADFDHFYHQFLRQNHEYAGGFVESLISDDRDPGYTIIHLVVLCGHKRAHDDIVCKLLDFFIEYKEYKEALHVRNNSRLPTALHLAAYLGRKRAFIRLYKAGVRCTAGDMSILTTVELGKQHSALFGLNDNIWSRDIDQVLLSKSSFCNEAFFTYEHDWIQHFCKVYYDI